MINSVIEVFVYTQHFSTNSLIIMIIIYRKEERKWENGKVENVFIWKCKRRRTIKYKQLFMLNARNYIRSSIQWKFKILFSTMCKCKGIILYKEP